VGIDRSVVLPFAWRHVDAYHLLPDFAGLRRRIDGSSDPSSPQRVAETLIGVVDAAIGEGGHASLVFHTWLIEAERDAVRAVLGHVRTSAQRGDVWAARCDQAADWIKQHPSSFPQKATLDRTSWLQP
jgi:hypothetical protein